MFERILVPLDGSVFSEEMLAHATGLAAVRGTPLTLMRVVDKGADEAEARAYVEALAARHGARGICVVAHGDVADTVLDEAAGVPHTLVAMSSRGRSGLMEAVLGSVAQRVVRGADAPVLVYRPTGRAPAGGGAVSVRRIVLPLDGSALSEVMGLQAAEFARWAGAELEVVRVVDATGAAGLPAGGELAALESGYVRSKATELGRSHGVPVNWDVLHGDPVQAIASHVAGHSDTVLAMVTRRQGAVETALLGSVTAGCLRQAGVPVLMRAP